MSSFCIFIYHSAPIFGALPGSIAIVRRDGNYVMIDRSDGLGLSFPGGLIHPWESAEKALRREILEETGLEVTDLIFKFSYSDSTFLPTQTSVWEAQTRGALRSSWEGDVVEVPASEVHSRIMESQRPVLDKLLSLDQIDIHEQEDSVLA